MGSEREGGGGIPCPRPAVQPFRVPECMTHSLYLYVAGASPSLCVQYDDIGPFDPAALFLSSKKDPIYGVSSEKGRLLFRECRSSSTLTPAQTHRPTEGNS